MSEQKKKLKRVEVFKTEIDFNRLSEWFDSDEHDNLPVVGYISFYRAIGLLEAAERYSKDHPDFYLHHLDSILCNYTTNQRVKHLIEDNWSRYDIDIDRDNHPFWNTKKYPKGAKHYSKTLRPRIEKVLGKDFITYTPGLDDELGASEIILVDWIEIADDDPTEE